MTAVLNRSDLEALVIGSQPYYSHWNYPLVVKAGHFTDSELWQLRTLCVESWPKP